MKKTILFLLLLSLLLLTACEGDVPDEGLDWGLASYTVRIIKDPEYGCQYIFITDQGFMPRLDKQGNVVCN